MLPVTRFVALPRFAEQAQRSVTCPKGFAAAGVACGLKKKGRLDLGLLASLRPAVSAATFTSNAAAAAPVRVTRETSACDGLRAVVVNAGNANACTGEQGLADAARMRSLAARHLRLPGELVAVASTGVIGVPLDMARVEAGIAAAAAAIRPGGGEHFSQAIRTTDASPKRGALVLETVDGVVRLGAAAKGCGMISPRMATMLCFVTCDAALAAEDWRRLLTSAVGRSFNRITVDGQESTNDMVAGFANGASGVHLGEVGLGQLAEALDALLLALAVGMVADGEGATKAVRLTVSGARDAGEGERVARAVADSPLVKTAFFGRDANWGRIVQAAGQALGAQAAPGADAASAANGGESAATAAVAADVLYEDLAVVRGGRPVPLGEGEQERLADIMAQHEIDVRLRLNGGPADATVFFSDLTHDYVTLNAEYTT
jgi:glutamate N-acetyltransferase / amino-acid N-acetyltransferase